jgi:hypothetical protein
MATVQPQQLDLFRGLRMWSDPEARLRLEGTVALASKYTGLAPRTIRDYIEDGEIASRQPARNRESDQGKGRNHKHFVDMSDVWRIAYGRQKAEEMCAGVGVVPRWKWKGRVG